MIIGSLLVGFLVTAVGALALTSRKRRRRPARWDAPEFGPIRPAVRLLSTDEELREAIERAVAYERRSADRTLERIHRYSHISPERSTSELVSSDGAELIAFDSSHGKDLHHRR